MSVELEFPLAIEHFRSASPTLLIEQVKGWMKKDDISCLLHPHGFWVVLLNRSETEEWRFHYWPKESRKTTGMPARIHTHDKIVESRILVGELKNIEYNLVKVKSGGQPIYQVVYDGDKYFQETSNVLRKTDERAVAIARVEEILRVGNSYRVEAHTYHEAIVAEGVEAATIVCMHSPVAGGAKVLGLASYPDEIVFRRVSRPVGELLRII